jgi:hypothetical protein
MIRINLHGANRASRKLSRAGSGVVKNVERNTKKAVLFVHSEIPGYPPQVAGSDYRRTGTAGRTVTTFGVTPVGGGGMSLSEVKPLFDGAKGLVGGKLEYLPYLIDETYQTEVHKRNGWWTLQSVIRKLKDGIVQIYKTGIKELLNG